MTAGDAEPWALAGGGAVAPHAPSICLGVATCGRPEILRNVLDSVKFQRTAPAEVVVCYTQPSDIAGIAPAPCGPAIACRFIACAPGLPRQRNAILAACAGYDVVLFIDDDFIMAPGYIEAVASAFAAAPDMVASTGTLIHDDVKGPGLSVGAGLAFVELDSRQDAVRPEPAWRRAPHAYGCNMALRLSTIAAHGLRFDERLPLYGWSEDIDFTHRIGRFGIIAKLTFARGVHLGVKQGRSPGRRLGYSQVANPIYLLRKGSYSAGRAMRSVARNVAANCARAAWPEPYIDRRGRLAGNILAIGDMLRGKMQPERILDF
jgi:hypothetical protein